MFLLIIAGLAVIVALGLGAGIKEVGPKVVAVTISLIVAAASFLFGSFYTQDIGEAKVLKNMDGTIQGQDIDPGFAFKAPWVEAIDFDIRNQQAIYKGAGTGKDENGPQITIQDKDKVSADVDIAIRYSILPDKVTSIYTEYQSQANFTARLVDQDMKSVVRNTFSTFTTAQVLESRAAIELKISEALKERWKDQGVTVESVALQDIRYPQATRDGFTDAQQSVTSLKKAEADLKVVESQSKQKVINAEAEAKANSTINKSLSPEILELRRQENLAKMAEKGTVYVVPENFSALGNISGKQ